MKSVGPQVLSDRSRLKVSLYLSRSVVGQQLSGKAADTIWRRVQAQCKQEGLTLAALVGRDGGDWLRGCGVSGSKARAIAALHEAEAAGLLDKRRLGRMDHETRSAHVGQIWGIGQWTCDMLSMFYFAEPDIWPRADSAANKVLAWYAARDDFEGQSWEAADLFCPYRSYLAMYTWRIADRRLL
jgi:DNA-3-methyladenine glycosylase II